MDDQAGRNRQARAAAHVGPRMARGAAAVLGFIGLCGVLQRESTGTPEWLQITSGILILVALALACIATVLVATAAWPVDDTDRPRTPGADDEAEIRRTFGRLRAGIVLTFVAVVVLAVATSSAWWPSAEADQSGLVEVSTAQGTVCGALEHARSGVLTLDVDGQSVTVALGDVAEMAPVSTCP